MKMEGVPLVHLDPAQALVGAKTGLLIALDQPLDGAFIFLRVFLSSASVRSA
jgi:hypothetical protein